MAYRRCLAGILIVALLTGCVESSAGDPAPTLEVRPTARPTPSPAPTLTAAPTATSAPAPHVVAGYPIEGDLAVNPDLPIVLVFDQPMDPEATAAGLHISPAVAGRVTWTSERALAFQPDVPWSEPAYELRLDAGAAAAWGTPLAEPYILRFGAGGPGVPVPTLMYHHLAELAEDAGESARTWTVSPAAFAEQMAWLADHDWHSITPSELAAYLQGAPLPARPVIISMDDGYREVATVAWPVFRRTGLRPVLFVIPSHCGYRAYLDWPDLETLVADGAAIGSHTYDHVNLRQVGDDALAHQLGDSRAVLEERLGVRVDALCYPYGGYDARILDAVATYGYSTAFTLSQGVLQQPGEPYQMQRLLITYTTTLDAFAELLS
ncbi:MAG: polysaccharide deacetylase family protein [Anaerolineae bacterium]